MQSYSLAAMLPHRHGTAQLPMLRESLSLERGMLSTLRRMLRACAATIREVVLPEFERTPSLSQDALTRDVDSDTFERMRQVFRGLVRVAAEAVRDLLRAESVRHTDQFVSVARRALGVDLRAVVRAEDLEAFVDAVALRNAGLITGITDELASRVQRLTTTAVLQGRTTRELQGQIAQALRSSDARARLIARDQTAKLNSELNERRHRQAGITRYIWRTARDERVRPLHRRLDGQEFEYGERTPAEEGLPPGQPIQCRCVAQAVVEF